MEDEAEYIENPTPLDLEIINMQLPVITTNFEDIKTKLIETMQKYSGLVVTEDTLMSSKATQKELAGVRIKVDNYRKEKKKELSKPIDEFESQCKELIKLIEDTEKPIKEGIEVFDNKKREEKRQKALLIINKAIEDNGLTEQYAKQLTVLDKYINLTSTVKEVKGDIAQRVLLLVEQRNKELERAEIITNAIDNANKTITAKLSVEDFLNFYNADVPTVVIVQQINERAERIRIAELPKVEEVAPVSDSVVEELSLETKQAIDEAFDPVVPTEKIYFVEFKVVGSKEEVMQLSDYLKVWSYKYTVIKKGLEGK